MSDWRAWPVYLLTTRPRSAFSQVLVPVWARRVILAVSGRDSDVLLEAAAGLHAAGVTDAQEQSRVLGLPLDLLEFLLSQVAIEAAGPAAVTSSNRRTATLFQSYDHGRVLGRDVTSPRPALLEYTPSGWPRTILEGSRGDPVRLRTFAVPPEAIRAEPPALRPADAAHALRRRYDGHLQVTPVGTAAPALVCAYVSRNVNDEPTILDPVSNVVDVELTGLVRRRAEKDPRLAEWLRPSTDRELPRQGRLSVAVDHLRSVDRSAKGERLLDRATAHALADAMRDVLLAATEILKANLPSPAPHPLQPELQRGPDADGPGALWARGDAVDDLATEVDAVARSLEVHRIHPRLGRIPPAQLSTAARLTFAASADLDPRRGFSAVNAAKERITAGLLELADLVQPLEDING